MPDWEEEREEETSNPFDRIMGRQLEAEIGFRRYIAISSEKWRSSHIRALVKHVRKLVPLDSSLEKLSSWNLDRKIGRIAFNAYENALDAQEIPELNPKDVPLLVDAMKRAIHTAFKIWHTPDDPPSKAPAR